MSYVIERNIHNQTNGVLFILEVTSWLFDTKAGTAKDVLNDEM